MVAQHRIMTKTLVPSMVGSEMQTPENMLGNMINKCRQKITQEKRKQGDDIARITKGWVGEV